MKYKIGDKVRYDGGDWWFYGTVSAGFEHSIINVVNICR